MKTYFLPLLFIFLSACSKDSFDAAKYADGAPKAPEALAPKSEFETPLQYDLLKFHKKEIRGLSPEQIEALNKKTLAALKEYKIEHVVQTKKGPRLNALFYDDATDVMRSISKHPVVGNYGGSKYKRPNVEIGFCFGRAAYTHLALLKVGVNKEAIRKAWVVGSIDTGEKWSFHVATIVKAKDQDHWWVVDNFPGQVLNLEDWFTQMKEFNKKGDLRLYITSPQKFSVSLSTYDRVQLGLDLTREQDWYQHYFLDLLNWFRKEPLSSVDLSDLRKS